MDNYKRIFIVSLTPRTIGDPIILTPIFKILKRIYPESYIIMTATKTNYPLFQYHPSINEVYYIPELHDIGDSNISKFKKLWLFIKFYFRLIKKINKSNIDLLLISEPFSFFSQNINLFCKAKKTVGYTLDKESLAYGSYTLKKFDDSVRYIETYSKYQDNHVIHLVENNLNLIKAIDPSIEIKKEEVVAEVFIPEDKVKQAKEKIKKDFSLKEENNICCMHLFSKNKIIRQWPLKKYEELIKKLLKKDPKLHIFLVGTKDESIDAEAMVNAVENKNLHNICGLLEIIELGALLKISKYCIGNDSGICHLSSAVGTKTFVIYGTSTPLKALPIGKGKTIPIYHGEIPPQRTILEYSEEAIKKMDATTTEEAYKIITRDI